MHLTLAYSASTPIAELVQRYAAFHCSDQMVMWGWAQDEYPHDPALSPPARRFLRWATNERRIGRAFGTSAEVAVALGRPLMPVARCIEALEVCEAAGWVVLARNASGEIVGGVVDMRRFEPCEPFDPSEFDNCDDVDGQHPGRPAER